MSAAKKTIHLRSSVIVSSMVILAIVVLFKIFKLQVLEPEVWQMTAQNSPFKYREVKSLRGNILSDDGQLLATSLPLFRLAFDPTIVKQTIFEAQIDSLCFLLADFFQEKPAEDYRLQLEDLRTNNKRYVILSNRLLTQTECAVLRQWPIFKLGRYGGGLLFEKIEKRHRPYENLARRTIGLEEDTSRQIFGRGLEYSYNEALTGRKGRGLFQKTPNNTWRLLPTEDFIRPENGYNIHTTIDIKLQKYVNDELNKTLQKHQASYGCALVMEVKTGHIKAIANLGKVGPDKYTENYNYAIGNQGTTEPGSTIKTASLMALLEAYQVDIEHVVNTMQGEYEFDAECIMRDVQYGGYGMLTLGEAFTKSSNIGISRQVVQRFDANPQGFVDYLYKFGLTLPINYQIKGAGLPYITQVNDETWSNCSLPWISIGYEMKASPIQILTFYNAIANQGHLIQPIIVKSISKQAKIVKTYTSQTIVEKICSDQTLATVQKLLEAVVLEGTAKNISGGAYKIAGKTGTAHKFKQKQYINNYYTSFVGYFPIEEPRYTCIVVVDDPQGDEHFGGNVAAPLFKKIADKLYYTRLYKDFKDQPDQVSLPHSNAGYFSNLKKLAEYFDFKQKPIAEKNPWVRTHNQSDTVEWVKRYVIENLVPDATGMTLIDALFLLENRGLNVKVKGRGRVLRQSLIPGTRIRKGMTITLTLRS